MGNSSQIINKHPQFNNLPTELRNWLEQFYKAGYIPADILPEIKTSLLDAINNQKLSSGYSPIYPNRISYDKNELIVWLGVHFPVHIKKEPESIFEPDKKISKRICLICFKKYERYDFIWEHDIEDKIKDHKDIIDIKIITDYKKMLPLVRSFKKTMQQKIGELPYLGKANDQGNLVLLEKEIFRPNYSRINDEQLIRLENCICILLGIDDFDLIVSIDNHLDLITEEQGRYLWEDDFMSLPFVHADNPFRDVIVTAKYREGWRDVISFIKDFVKKINSASEAGSIDLVNYSTLMGDHVKLHDIKTHQYNFKTRFFLKWAKEAEYAIPLELSSFIENDDSNIGIDELRPFKKKDVLEDVEDKINSFLKKIRPEIDMFYESLKLHARHDGRGTLDISYDDACEVFEKKKAIFEIIEFEDIHKSFFGVSEKPYREIKGGVMRNLIIKTYPEAKSHTSKIKLSAQALYARSNSL
jgi:hypothetical protein